MPYLRVSRDGSIVLSVYVQPKASRSAVVGRHGESLKIAVNAPPLDGRANKAVAVFLASFFQLPRKNIRLQSGAQSRHKQFQLIGKDMEELRGIIRSACQWQGEDGG